ncbi:MAG: hypothetical protein CL908_12135 [Deltaproteobacteria bacterium]|jgi:steroid delta-isomerase|nr:hypothetical protein [Deltaproteobacteria bacterium]
MTTIAKGRSELGTVAATNLVECYLERHAGLDLEGLLELFAEEATVEDPVGAALHFGLEAIRSFYRETHVRIGRLVIERVGDVLVGGDEIAFRVRARLAAAEDASGMDVIYSLRVDDELRIASLRAFF